MPPWPHHAVPSHPSLEARDLIWIAALGIASRRDLPADQLPGHLTTLTGGGFRPAAEVVDICLEEMVAGGHLLSTVQGRLRTAPTGRQTLTHLLTMPAGGGMSDTARRIKLAFLDLVGPGERLDILEALIQELETAAKALSAPSWSTGRGCYGIAWQAHEMGKLDADLKFLRLLSADAALACPA